MKTFAVLLDERTAAADVPLHAWSADLSVADAPLTHTRAPVTELAATARAALQTIVLVPMHMLAWHTVRLPRGLRTSGDARLLPVLQNQLEDELAAEPSQTHIALAPDAAAHIDSAAPTLVAVCDSAWLSQWLHTLQDQGISTARVVPQVAPELMGAARAQASVEQPTPVAICTGTAAAAWVSTLVPEAADAASTVQQPQTPDRSLGGFSAGSPGQDARADAPPPHAYAKPQERTAIILTVPLGRDTPALLSQIGSSAGAWLSIPSAWEEAAHHVGRDRVQLLDERALLQAALDSAWNLAQHHLAPSPTQRLRRQALARIQSWTHAPQWAAVRWAAAALVLSLFVGLHTHWWLQERSARLKQEAIAQLARTHLGANTLIVDAPRQMQRALHDERTRQGVLSAGDLSSMLSAVATALSQMQATAHTSVEGNTTWAISHVQYTGASAAGTDAVLSLHGTLQTSSNTAAQFVQALRQSLLALGYEAQLVDDASSASAAADAALVRVRITPSPVAAF